MIRYKKRKFQQGGSSPAADYAAGAAAVNTTFTPIQNPYKRIEMQPTGGSGTTAGGGKGGGSRIGRGQFNSIMQSGPLVSKNLPALTEAKNEELDIDKQRLIEIYSINDKYFESAAGLNELNDYKKKLVGFKSELNALENVYAHALKNVGQDSSRIVFSSDGDVFVLDDKLVIKAMTYEQAMTKQQEYSKDNTDDRALYQPLTIGTLLSYMDDVDQYKGDSALDKDMLIDALGSIVNEEQVNKTFISGVQKLFKDTEWDSDHNLLIEGGDASEVNDIILSAQDIAAFEADGTESKKMESFIDDHYTYAPTSVRNFFTEQAYSSKKVEHAVENSKPDQRSNAIRIAIRQSVFQKIKGNLLSGKVQSPEEQTKARDRNNDMVTVAMANDYNRAETGLLDTEKVVIDVAIQKFNEDGSKKSPADIQNELAVRVNLSHVSQSGSDLDDNYMKFVKEADDGYRELEDVTFSMFEAITKVANTDKAVMGSGFNVSEIEFDDDHKGLVPILDQKMSVVATLATKGTQKLATDAIPLIHALQKEYKIAHTQATKDNAARKSNMSFDKTVDDVRYIENKTDEYMRDKVTKILADSAYKGMSLEDFYNNFIYKNFYKVDVIGNFGSTPFGIEGEENMEYLTDKLTDEARRTAKAYGLYGTFNVGLDNVMMTSILIPAIGVNWKPTKGAKHDLGKAAADVKDAIMTPVPIDMRDLLSKGSNKALENFIIKRSTQ